MSDRTEWKPPPRACPLQDNEVHVWRARLDAPGSAASLSELQQILSSDEQEKAARFHFDIDRSRFVVGRGVLRLLLAQYLGRTPDSLRFAYSPFGKPALAPASTGRQIEFNVSHSGDVVLIAVTSGHVVGVDVERIRSEFAGDRIAADFFSPHECAALRGLEAAAQTEGFFACWTRKEAFIKGKGQGLSLPLRDFDVSVEPAGPARLLATRPVAAEAERWDLRHLDVGPGYMAALAVEGTHWSLRTWEWLPETACPATMKA